jgi:hypothetical protein
MHGRGQVPCERKVLEIKWFVGTAPPVWHQKWIEDESPRTTWIFDAPGVPIALLHGGRGLKGSACAAIVVLEVVALDVPTAPAIVLERPAPCNDATQAEELLKRTLAPALAPRASWAVVARFSRKGSLLAVEAEITDEADSPVAHRVLTDASLECSSLARAVGVWASLVLDSEVERAARLAPPPTPPAPAASAEPPPATSAAADKSSRGGSVLLDNPEDGRTVEFGVTMAVMGGLGSGVMAGPTLYSSIEVGRGFFLRPALLIERGLQGTSAEADIGTVVATRFDACGRVSGFHIKVIQLEICGGGEIGFMHIDAPSEPSSATVFASSTTLPFLAFGPSMSLRGELGGGLALVLRGVADLNALSEQFTDNVSCSGDTTACIGGKLGFPISSSPFLARAELGLSWQMR